MDNIKGIHLLTFVLMQSLNLDIENGIRIQSNTLRLLYIGCQLLFLYFLNFCQTIQHALVIGEL